MPKADLNLIKCENLAFGYDGSTALRDLNFSLEEGGRLCVAGENGSGKSTLLRGLLGLLPPLEGFLRKSPALKTAETGYLPQESAVQRDFPASVFEVTLSGRQNRRGLRPFYTKADRAAAAEKLELLGIADLSRKSYRELSGGQRRRVLLARALCAAGKLLLLDEPAAGLDPLVQDSFYKLLNKVNVEQGVAIIMVSHDMAGILEFAGNAGKVLHLAGRQVFFGGAEQYRQTEAGKRFLYGTGGGAPQIA